MPDSPFFKFFSHFSNVDRLDSFLYNVPDAHCGIINAIDTVGSVENHGASEIVTGGKDGFVKVWDPRQNNDPVVKIEPDEQVCITVDSILNKKYNQHSNFVILISLDWRHRKRLLVRCIW